MCILCRGWIPCWQIRQIIHTVCYYYLFYGMIGGTQEVIYCRSALLTSPLMCPSLCSINSTVIRDCRGSDSIRGGPLIQSFPRSGRGHVCSFRTKKPKSGFVYASKVCVIAYLGFVSCPYSIIRGLISGWVKTLVHDSPYKIRRPTHCSLVTPIGHCEPGFAFVLLRLFRYVNKTGIT